MANTMQSADLFRLMQQANSPGKWKTPAGLKRAYRDYLTAAKADDAAVNAGIKALEQQSANSGKYDALLALYHNVFDAGAGTLPVEVSRLAATLDGGAGNSYAAPVALQTVESMHGKKGEKVPALLAAGSKAAAADRAARAAQIRALSEGNARKSEALEAVFSAKLEALADQEASKRKGYHDKLQSLAKAYAARKKAEK